MNCMDKYEYIEELDKKIRTLTELHKNAMEKNENETARRLEGKIEGVKLAREFARTWLKEDTKDGK